MEVGEDGVGFGEDFDALGVGFELRSGDGEEGYVVGEEVEVGACSAAAEAEGGAAGVHDLRDYGAGWAAHGWRILIFDLLGGFGEDEGLVGVDEEHDNVWREWGLGEGAVDDVLRLGFEDGDLREVFFADVA